MRADRAQQVSDLSRARSPPSTTTCSPDAGATGLEVPLGALSVAGAGGAGGLIAPLPHAAEQHVLLDRRDALQPAFLAGHPGGLVAHRVELLLRAREEA